MGILATSKARNSDHNSGMGFLLVFFPEEDRHHSTSDSSDIVHKSNLLSSSSEPRHPSPFRRTHSGRLLSRAQSTISICALLVSLTLLVFTLSTFDSPSSSASAPAPPSYSRRFLPERQPTPRQPPQQPQPLLTPDPRNDRAPSSFWSFPTFSWRAKPKNGGSKHQFALQGMGTLYRRGTRAMNDLVVAHLAENLSEEELRFFLRTLHRSGLTAKADVVLIFPSHASASRFGSVIREEDESFSKLLYHYTRQFNATSRSPASFDATHFVKSSKEAREPLWGKRARIGISSSDDTAAAAASGMEASLDESARPSYGSVVGFEAGELDPENSLSGFLDHVPMSLRRWACYSMLLGRVRRSFKHAMLVDAKSWAVLRDPLGRVRSRSPETVHLLTTAASKAESSKHGHGRKNSDRTRPHGSVSPGVVMGGARGVRRLAAAMLNEVVRASMQQQRKRKSPVTESEVLSQLASNEFVLSNVNLAVVSAEESGGGGHSGSSSLIKYGNNGNSSHNHDVKGMIMRQICWSEVDSSVYIDC